MEETSDQFKFYHTSDQFKFYQKLNRLSNSVADMVRVLHSQTHQH